MSTTPISVDPRFPLFAVPFQFDDNRLLRADATSLDVFCALTGPNADGPLRFVVAADETVANKVLGTLACMHVGRLGSRFQVQVLRWFGGNTYHSFKIKHDGLVICQWHGPHYGYDDHYRVSAHEWLLQHGWVPEVENQIIGGWPTLRNFGVDFVSVIDVKTKRELLCS